ncbi:MAG: hypothetical protein EU532_12895, partial [Promethearchaeota archaeon]
MFSELHFSYISHHNIITIPHPLNMNFKTVVNTSYRDIPVEEYFDGSCPKCGSLALGIRSSYKRTLLDLGAPQERRFVRLKVNYFECGTCDHPFSPKHPEFPSKLEYSPSIIHYVLERYHRDNISGNKIADVLKKSHEVDVPVDTVYSWIKIHSAEYLKAMEQEKIIDHPESIKTVTLDGTFTSAGSD